MIEPKVSVVGLFIGPLLQRALRSTGSLQGRFPGFTATTTRSDFPCPRCFALAMCPRFHPHGWRHGISQVPWRPSLACPCPATPASDTGRRASSPVLLPAMTSDISALAINPFSRLDAGARQLAVYASQSRLPGHHARLAIGWCLPCRTGLEPAGTRHMISVSWLHDVLLHVRAHLAHRGLG